MDVVHLLRCSHIASGRVIAELKCTCLKYEISSNPTVVDLLVSFSYIAARHKALNPLPMGIGLRVKSASNGDTEDFEALSESEAIL